MNSAVTVNLIEEARGGPFVFWHDLPAACRTAAELGFDAIELFLPSADAVEDLGLGLDNETCTVVACAGRPPAAGWIVLHLSESGTRAVEACRA